MRTRRSPRNQDRLWRALGAPMPSAQEIEVALSGPPRPRTAEEIDAMWWIPRRSRTLLKRDLARDARKEGG